MKHYNPFIFDDGEGAAASATGTGDAAQSQAQDDRGETQETQTEEKPARKTLQDLMNEDAELAREYHEKTEKLIKNRLKGVNDLKKRDAAYQESYRLLADIYPDMPKDATPEVMNQYLKGKSDLWAQAAADAGMSVDAYQRFTEAQRDNERIRGEQQARQQEMQLQARYQQIEQEAAACKAVYPSFDLMTELDNPMFAAIVNAGTFTVQQAFEAAHVNELVSGAVQTASQNAAEAATKKTVNALRNSQNRPSENGLRGTVGEQHTMKVSDMTDEDMERYIELARSGHHVTFRR